MRLTLAVVCTLLASAGCTADPTTAVVENGYPAAADAADTMTVFKVWWVTTLFPNPVAPAASSETERVVPGRDFAYALGAPGWAPGSGAPPPRLVALKSVQPLTVSEADLLTIIVDDGRFAGDCAAGGTLGPADAELIVGRIFPGDFAGLAYDPATCTTTPATADAGAADAAGD